MYLIIQQLPVGSSPHWTTLQKIMIKHNMIRLDYHFYIHTFICRVSGLKFLNNNRSPSFVKTFLIFKLFSNLYKLLSHKITVKNMKGFSGSPLMVGVRYSWTVSFNPKPRLQGKEGLEDMEWVPMVLDEVEKGGGINKLSSWPWLKFTNILISTWIWL